MEPPQIDNVAATGEPTDAELVQRMSRRDGDALAALFRRYARFVYAIAHGILKDRGEAEDITQDVFLEIYRKAHLYDPARGSFRAWLLQYVYHRTIRRKLSLQRRAAYRAEPIDAEAHAQAAPASLSRAECRWVIRSGLALLSGHQRATLELTCFEELPLRDVAARLGVSVGCTRHYYYRGLARLRQWARVTRTEPSQRCRNGASAGRADAATDQGPRRYAPIGRHVAPAPR